MVANIRHMSREGLVDFIASTMMKMKELKEGATIDDISYEVGVESVLSYLENPNGNVCPSHVGLSPQQINENPLAHHLKYFRDVVKKCEKSTPEYKKKILENFQQLYPNIFKLIMNEMTKAILDVEKQKPNIYAEILRQLQISVVGQKEAVENLASTLTSQEHVNKNRTFLFVGPTGVGKTELAKAVGKIKRKLITFPMNEYQNEMYGPKFFGAGPGLVGSSDKSHFAVALDKVKPKLLRTEGNTEFYEVENIALLFDEFEKAHSTIKQSFLTLFDEWFCNLSYTKDDKNVNVEYRFKNCIAIATSNLYQNQILQAFNNNLSFNVISEKFKELNYRYPTTDSFSQELLGRMCILPFGPIPKGEFYQNLIKKKISIFLDSLKMEYNFKEIVIVDEPRLLVLLENKLYGNGVNIRKISEYFEKIIKVINLNKSEWGNLEKAKLVFYPSQEKVFIKVMLFLDTLGIYNDIANPIEI